MADHGGFREGGGRPRGAKNKRTVAVEETIRALGCPFTAMARIAQAAEKVGDLSTAGRMNAELARYLAPQRKAVDPEEVKARAPGMGLTLDQVRRLKGLLIAGDPNVSAVIREENEDNPDARQVN